MSVSLPFFVPSLHVGLWHLPLVHTELVQSEPTPHVFPAAHFGHVPPPQLRSVSLPFLTWSVQLGA
jgi:hypothetical protein